MLNLNVPEEVVIDILLQLPADTLVRFRCVCKSWYAHIENPEFKAMHCNKYVHSPSSNKNSNLYLLVKNWDLTDTGKEGNILSLLTYDDRMRTTFDGEDVSFVVKNVELPFFKYTGFSISGHCDGIICLYAVHDSRPTVILANPGIREFRALPESCIPLSGQNKCQCYSVTVGVGLGFDRRTNDYKVVRILEFFSPRGSPKGVIEAEVYSLRSNSWKQIEYLDPCTHIFNFGYNSFLCYWNGAYYWPAVARNQQHHLIYGILSFDLSDEAFQFITLPKFVSNNLHSYPNFSIIVLNESLALVAYHNCGIENSAGSTEQQFDIWVMDELRVSGTWTKLLSTGPLLGVEKPVGFWKSDELLVMLSSGRLASYNIVTNQMKNLPINGEALYVEAVIYKSSLVSVINY